MNTSPLLSLLTPLCLAALPRTATAAQGSDNLVYAAMLLGEQFFPTVDSFAHMGDFAVMIPSTSSGPTTVGGVTLGVGLELPGFWKVGIVDGTGSVGFPYFIPDLPSLPGIDMHLQVVFADPIMLQPTGVTNPMTSYLRKAGEPIAAPLFGSAVGSAVAPVYGSATPTEWMLAGGLEADPIFGLVPTDNVLRVDRAEATTEVFTHLLAPRAFADASAYVPLGGNPSMFVTQGLNAFGQPSKTAERVDFVTGVVSALPSSTHPHFGGACVGLPGGDMFFFGGTTSSDLSPATVASKIHGQQERWSASTGQWSFDPGWIMLKGLIGHRVALLQDGRFLITGGIEAGTGAITKECWIYDPVGQFYTPAADLPQGLFEHDMLALSDGTVIAWGGGKGSLTSIQASDDAYRWNPVADVWSFHAKVKPRMRATITIGEKGVIVTGGLGGNVTLTSTGLQGDPVTAVEAISANGAALVANLPGTTTVGGRFALLHEADGGDLVNLVIVGEQQVTEELSFRWSSVLP